MDNTSKENNQSLEDTVKNLKNIVEEQNKKIEILNKEIKEIKFELDQIKKGKEISLKTCYERSNSLIYQNEFDLIYNWICPNTKIKLELIYKASIDGDSAENFHKKCDNIHKSTLVVIQSRNGYRFGGYTTGNWGDYKQQEDANAFVFSLTNKNKVKVQSPKEPIAIYPLVDLGPRFGHITFEISSNCFSNKSSYIYYDSRYKINTNHFIGIDSTETIYFQVDDYEIYRVIFS